MYHTFQFIDCTLFRRTMVFFFFPFWIETLKGMDGRSSSWVSFLPPDIRAIRTMDAYLVVGMILETLFLWKLGIGWSGLTV